MLSFSHSEDTAPSRLIPGLATHALPVFSVGRDSSLLSRRKAAMESCGIVPRLFSPEQAEAYVHELAPRVWIFCGSIEPSTLIYLAGCIRRHSPGSSLLLVEYRNSTGLEGSLFHRLIGREVGPEFLANTVQRLVRTA